MLFLCQYLVKFAKREGDEDTQSFESEDNEGLFSNLAFNFSFPLISYHANSFVCFWRNFLNLIKVVLYWNKAISYAAAKTDVTLRFLYFKLKTSSSKRLFQLSYNFPARLHATDQTVGFEN